MCFFMLVLSCGQESNYEEHKSFAETLEFAHKKDEFLSKDIIEFDLLLKFRGKERLNGTLALTTDSQKGVITEKNGDQLYYDGDQVFYKYRDSLDSEKIRFKAYTWSYFFLFPYKLSDPGVIWSDYENKLLNEKSYDVEKLSFEEGTGDSPDDWYITYADTATNLVYATAYIVTYTKSQTKAEEDPHAIVYEDYKEVDEVPLSHRWTFWEWRDGVLSNQIGEATLSNFKFLDKEERSFEVPNGYVEI